MCANFLVQTEGPDMYPTISGSNRGTRYVSNKNLNQISTMFSWIIISVLYNLSKLTVILSKSRKVHNSSQRHLPYRGQLKKKFPHWHKLKLLILDYVILWSRSNYDYLFRLEFSIAVAISNFIKLVKLKQYLHMNFIYFKGNL